MRDVSWLYHDWYWFLRSISFFLVFGAFLLAAELPKNQKGIKLVGFFVLAYSGVFEVFLSLPVFGKYSYGLPFVLAFITAPGLTLFLFYYVKTFTPGKTEKLIYELDKQTSLSLEMRGKLKEKQKVIDAIKSDRLLLKDKLNLSEEEKFVIQFKLDERERLMKSINRNLTHVSLAYITQMHILDEIESKRDIEEYKSLLNGSSKKVVEGLRKIHEQSKAEINL
mgnify:FL=1